LEKKMKTIAVKYYRAFSKDKDNKKKGSKDEGAEPGELSTKEKNALRDEVKKMMIETETDAILIGTKKSTNNAVLLTKSEKVPGNEDAFVMQAVTEVLKDNGHTAAQVLRKLKEIRNANAKAVYQLRIGTAPKSMMNADTLGTTRPTKRARTEVEEEEDDEEESEEDDDASD